MQKKKRELNTDGRWLHGPCLFACFLCNTSRPLFFFFLPATAQLLFASLNLPCLSLFHALLHSPTHHQLTTQFFPILHSTATKQELPPHFPSRSAVVVIPSIPLSSPYSSFFFSIGHHWAVQLSCQKCSLPPSPPCQTKIFIFLYFYSSHLNYSSHCISLHDPHLSIIASAPHSFLPSLIHLSTLLHVTSPHTIFHSSTIEQTDCVS